MTQRWDEPNGNPFPGDMDAERRAAAKSIVDLLAFTENLERELRHSWLSDGRQESVAEHTW